jgi:hypothetical protein
LQLNVCERRAKDAAEEGDYDTAVKVLTAWLPKGDAAEAAEFDPMNPILATCQGQNRACDTTASGAQCGACVPSFIDDTANPQNCRAVRTCAGQYRPICGSG